MKLYQQQHPTSLTRIHKRLIQVVKEMGLKFTIEQEMPPYWIDVYLTEFHIGLEADGPYHRHSKDSKRDEYLLEQYNLPILRIKENMLKSAKRYSEVKQLISTFIDNAYTE